VFTLQIRSTSSTLPFQYFLSFNVLTIEWVYKNRLILSTLDHTGIPTEGLGYGDRLKELALVKKRDNSKICPTQSLKYPPHHPVIGS
jgi:hypothetical protein